MKTPQKSIAPARIPGWLPIILVLALVASWAPARDKGAQDDSTAGGKEATEDAGDEAPATVAVEREMLARAARLASGGQSGEALAVLDAAVERLPSSYHVRSARADLLASAGRFADAADDLTAAIESHPEEAWLFQRRGEIRFFAADIDGSLADFDRFLGRYPDRRPYHWQRGLSLYYAERFKDGIAQFEIHRTVNPDDVENAIWHFLCLAAGESVDAARQALIPYTDDPRVPMKEIHELFAGTGTEKAVLEAANRDASTENERQLRNNLCYAHLYLGLYHEAMGNEEKSLEHIRKAAVDHAMPHYMGRTAQVHLALRTKDKATEPPANPDTSAK